LAKTVKKEQKNRREIAFAKTSDFGYSDRVNRLSMKFLAKSFFDHPQKLMGLDFSPIMVVGLAIEE
jgi:hypothetical protein